jgi:hypothetical protein
MIALHRQRSTRLACSSECDRTLRRSHRSFEKNNDLPSRPTTRMQCCLRIGLRTASSQDQRRSPLARTFAFYGIASDVVLDELDVGTISF